MKKVIVLSVLIVCASFISAFAQNPVKGEIQQSGIYQPTSNVGFVMKTPPGNLVSSDLTAQAGKDVTFGFVFSFTGLGNSGEVTIKYTTLQPKVKGLLGYSAEKKMPVVKGEVTGWAGERLWNPAFHDPNPLPAGDYTIIIEVMGQTLNKTFTFK